MACQSQEARGDGPDAALMHPLHHRATSPSSICICGQPHFTKDSLLAKHGILE